MSSDMRFTAPLYTLAEAARYLDVPASTLTSWARGSTRRRRDGSAAKSAPIVTTVGSPASGSAIMPFVGLAESFALTAFRHAGVPLQRIRPALLRLDHELDIAHALASRALYTDGAEVLYDYARMTGDTPEARSARELVVVRNGQHVFTDVVDAYLHRVSFGDDGYAQVISLPQYREADIVLDPARGFGQPVFTHGGARVEDALSMFRAGEPLDVVSAEFGVNGAELEDAVRVALQHTA